MLIVQSMKHDQNELPIGHFKVLRGVGNEGYGRIEL